MRRELHLKAVGVSMELHTTKQPQMFHILRVQVESSSGSGIAFGSDMSGGISNILVNHVKVGDSPIGVNVETGQGRGGYIKDI